MVRADIPYTYCSRKKLAPRDGQPRWRDYWRFRRGGIDAPLPGSPGEQAFHVRYAELLAQAEAADAREAGPERHSFAWLAQAYLASPELAALAPITQNDYRKVIENRLVPAMGPERYDCIGRASIKAVRDAVLEQGLSARTANKIKQVASLLYSWAEEEELLPGDFVNPGKKLKRARGASQPITVWSEEEIALFLTACEPFMRTPVLLAAYTGQRREDLVQMQWSDCLGGTVRVRQNKTGEPLDIPCHPILREHLETVRTKFGGAVIRSTDGKPMTANGLSMALRRAIEAIDGMPSRTIHGLRYASAAMLEAAGCTMVEITSVIGHRTYQMGMKYARQRRDAKAAMARLERRA